LLPRHVRDVASREEEEEGMSHYGAPGGPGGPGSPAYGPGPGVPPSTATSKGFVGALFDFSFSHFITPMIVKAVYVLAVVALGLLWLALLLGAFSQGAGSGLLVLVLGPIAILIYLAFIRMTLEFYLAIVRMSQDVHQRGIV
jgi:hypothetical protein